MASRDISSRTAPKASRAKAGKGIYGQTHGQTPVQQEQSPSGLAQHIRSTTIGMAPATATPRASAYKTASKAVVTETEPAAAEPSVRNDDDYVYICGPQVKGWRQRIIGSPGRCSTRCIKALGHRMQRQFFTAFPVQLPAPASQQSCGDTSTISYARVAVLQPGGGGDTSVDTVETKPHLKALTQHVAGRLAVPDAFAAAGVKVLMDSGSGVPAISPELVGALQGQADVIQTPLTQVFVGHARVVTSLGQECDIETQSCPLH